MNNKILLVKPPFFTPWTPPLGIALLKSFLGQHAYHVRCFDFNTDSELWGTHHAYFAALQQLENTSINDGYSKLWWILNAHMLAYVNGASPADCSRVLDSIIPLYGIKHDRHVIQSLLPIVDKYFKRLEELTDRLDLADFGVVGASTYTTSLPSSLFFLKRIKQKYPYLMTVVGGGIFADDLAPGSYNLNVLLQEYPFVDHVVIGEGELLFLKLLQGELDKRVMSIADIEGTMLDIAESCLPDFSDLSLELYYHLTIEGGRSCPFQCQFCSETVQWGRYRKKPMSLFARQLVDLADRYGNKSFFLADSLINPYVTNLADELLKRKANILYDGYLRADEPVTNRDRVKLWARSGLYRVRLGLESGSAHVLGLIGKRTKPQIYSEVLKSLASAGVRTTTYWVLGFPGETEQDFQETLYFIREHRQHIYELEAHPYYYSPEGQVGSGQHEGYSLYPDDVTQIVKFKRWDIRDRGPTREETFNRLRRLTQFAADLGLPNIYTMSERFQAEDRWQLLHPLVAEVYGRTPMSRAVQIPHHPVTVFTEEQARQLTREAFDATSVLCYQALIKNNLDTTILSASINQLVHYNDVLQTRFRPSGPARMSEGHGRPISRTLSVYSCQGKSQEAIDVLERQIVEELAAEMRPEPGASMRVAAIVNEEQPSSRVLLLVHRAIADGRSLALLFEDLFRIYKQLSEGRKVSLHPMQKTYGEFVTGLAAPGALDADSPQRQETPDSRVGKLDASDLMEAQSSKAKSRTVWLGENLLKGISSATVVECGLRADEVLAGGFLRSLARANGRGPCGVDMTIDYRTIDTSLAHTVGFLTRLVQLPQVTSDDGLFGLHEAKRISSTDLPNNRGSQVSQRYSEDVKEKKVLLDLEYFIDEPWLGGDEWVPQGFVMSENGLRESYLLEIAPVLAGDGIAVYLKYQDRPDANELVKTMSSYLSQDVEAVLNSCDRYKAAKQFWLTEFSNVTSESIIKEIKRETCGVPGEGWASAQCEIRKSVLDGLQEKFQADLSTVLLAAYGVSLSRLSGRQTLTVVSSIGEKGVIPLKMNPSWDLSFNRFVQDVQRKIAQAIEYQPYASHFLMGSAGTTVHNHCPVSDIGYVFHNSDPGCERDELEKALKLYSVTGDEMGLVLEASLHREDIDVRFSFRQSLLDSQTVGEMSAYLITVLEGIVRRPSIPLGYIVLGKKKLL